MAFLHPSGVFNKDTANRGRQAPRHRQTGLACNMGEVVDISTTGIRVRCRRMPLGAVDLILTDYTRTGELMADVVWSRQSGPFHFDIGLKFRKLSREMTGRLGAIAQAHRFRRAG